MTLEQEYGLNAGLNKLKIGKFIKRNLKSAKKDISIKNIAKVVKVAAPLATSLIPVGGGVVSKLATSKVGKAVKGVTNSKIGKAVKKVATSKTGKTIGKGIKIAKTAKKTGLVSIPVKSSKNSTPSNIQFSLLNKNTTARISNPEILQDQDQFQDELSFENAKSISGTQRVAAFSPENFAETENFTDTSSTGSTSPSPIDTVPKDNTLLYVGGGIGALALIYFATKSSN